MGPRHSKRTLEIAVTPTKSEIEGVGEAGKLEKFVDGIVEKVVAANGHVDGELQQVRTERRMSRFPVLNQRRKSRMIQFSKRR
ncbi:UNVERIFIED_CONTAM: hypothetical protein PYX00_009797 [Menopon gallinae]|uniref:Uncharacterized protein n=1 Tax=Menopon gallinae TaxID=328185 RepID=A0AAW2HCZ7_9NEOP